jgi:ketosteroid isomerase-like protein
VGEENVEIVRELFTLFERRQHERAFEYYAEDIEWDGTGLSEFNPDITGVYRGHDGVRTYWREWLEAWSDIQFDLADVREGEGGNVVALVENQRQWGRHSGIETEVPPYALIFTLQDGKVVRWRAMFDQEQALREAGVSG